MKKNERELPRKPLELLVGILGLFGAIWLYVIGGFDTLTSLLPYSRQAERNALQEKEIQENASKGFPKPGDIPQPLQPGSRWQNVRTKRQ